MTGHTAQMAVETCRVLVGEADTSPDGKSQRMAEIPCGGRPTAESVGSRIPRMEPFDLRSTSQPQQPRVEVRRSTRRRRTVTAYRERDAIVVLIPESMSRADERRFVDDLVRKVLARESRVSAPRRDPELAERARGLVGRYLDPALQSFPEPRAVNWVTNQQQRWGSCTPSTRTIRLSNRLQVMPSWVVDYVLVHELVHLVEVTHSARFWHLVGRYPAAEKAKGYLEGYLAGQGRAGAETEDVD
jgi:predicted metal-dependent hydrolase